MTHPNIFLKWIAAVISPLVLAFPSVGNAQTAINYNTQPAPTSEAGVLAIANYAMRRSPAMDQLFSEVRNHGGTVDWEKAVGSPYLNENFLPCRIYVGDEFAGNYYYRHNAYNDEIEIKDYPGDPKKQSLHTDKRFRLIDGKKEISLKTLFTREGTYRNGYLNLILKGGRFNLYLHAKVKFTEGTQPVNSLVRPTPDKFTNFTDYYFSDTGKEEEVAFYLQERKKKFISTFDKETASKLKAYIRENKLRLKKEEDLIKIFGYLNTL